MVACSILRLCSYFAGRRSHSSLSYCQVSVAQGGSVARLRTSPSKPKSTLILSPNDTFLRQRRVSSTRLQRDMRIPSLPSSIVRSPKISPVFIERTSGTYPASALTASVLPIRLTGGILILICSLLLSDLVKARFSIYYRPCWARHRVHARGRMDGRRDWLMVHERWLRIFSSLLRRSRRGPGMTRKVSHWATWPSNLVRRLLDFTKMPN